MKKIEFPYGKEKVIHCFPEDELISVLESKIEEYSPKKTETDLIEESLLNPIDSPPLSELAKGKKSVVIIASDHTRPVPSKYIIPLMLREIRKGIPKAEITILIATGCHRQTTKDELVAKFGQEIVDNETILIHNCDDSGSLDCIGTLPSGGSCEINKIALEADLLVAEGFIEPHFFAGFSGGRKSVLPGIASRSTVLANHCSEFIASPFARTGILKENPIHRDMLWASETAGLSFIVNVVLNGKKEVIFSVSGHPEKAHSEGVSFLNSLCCVDAIPANIVITTNGGYPLDQNVYQAVKGMTAAEACVEAGGVIIMLAKSSDGVGGDHFFHQLADEKDIDNTMDLFLRRNRDETVPDQWQTQILLRVLKKARVIYVSDVDAETIKKMHMIPSDSLKKAISLAKSLLPNKKTRILAIPDGVSVIVKEK